MTIDRDEPLEPGSSWGIYRSVTRGDRVLCPYCARSMSMRVRLLRVGDCPLGTLNCTACYCLCPIDASTWRA